MKKKIFKILLAILVLVLVTTACQKKSGFEETTKGETATQEEKTTTQVENNEKISETKNATKEQAYVEGSTLGSSKSNFVVDREIWREILSEEDYYKANKPTEGLHIPKILIESEDGKKVNKEIDEEVENLKEIYKSIVEIGGYGDGEELGISATFSVYQNEEILSIHFVTENVFEVYLQKHKIYNFSLVDGKLIDDSELIKYLEIEENDLMTIMEDAIVNEYNKLSAYQKSNQEGVNFIYDTVNSVGLSLRNLWENFDLKKSNIFINEAGRPYFLFEEYGVSENESYTSLAPIEAKSITKNEYSEVYLRMAKELGINPDDKNNKGIMVYLGAGYDEESIKEVLKKLYPWQIIFTDYQDPQLLLSIKENQDDFDIDLNGQEFYLLVPKWENATTSLEELELNKDGKLEKINNRYLNSASKGTVLICQNQSDLYPNAEITLQYRDEKIKFSPAISLKDGEVELPIEIYNGEKILDWDKVKDENYSWAILEKLLELMAKG